LYKNDNYRHNIYCFDDKIITLVTKHAKTSNFQNETLVINKSKITCIALIFAQFFILNSVLAASKWQNHDVLSDIVSSFIEKNIDVNENDYKLTVFPIDVRLKLHRCDAPIEAFSSSPQSMTGRSTVGVRCKGTKPWKIYIPINITQYRNVLVTSRPLFRGQLIEQNCIRFARIELTRSNQPFMLEAKHVIGKILTRALNAGKPIKMHDLAAQNLVKRGQEVILIATTLSIQVRMNGKALADGALGDLIRVKNLKTQKIVEGIVSKTGTVMVNM